MSYIPSLRSVVPELPACGALWRAIRSSRLRPLSSQTGGPSPSRLRTHPLLRLAGFGNRVLSPQEAYIELPSKGSSGPSLRTRFSKSPPPRQRPMWSASSTPPRPVFPPRTGVSDSQASQGQRWGPSVGIPEPPGCVYVIVPCRGGIHCCPILREQRLLGPAETPYQPTPTSGRVSSPQCRNPTLPLEPAPPPGRKTNEGAFFKALVCWNPCSRHQRGHVKFSHALKTYGIYIRGINYSLYVGPKVQSLTREMCRADVVLWARTPKAWNSRR